MSRQIAVTGAASGIGKAVANLAESRGWQPIRIDLREGDVQADLSTAAGRLTMIEEVERITGGRLDAVVACAGLSEVPTDAVIRVNFFGAVAALEGLRHLLARGTDPRAVTITSFASVFPLKAELVDACLQNDEAEACRIANEDVGSLVLYPASKAALSRWVRRESIKSEWVGDGILLNAVAPGFVSTPMVHHIATNAATRAELEKSMPMPIGRDLHPDEIAELLLWLASPANSTLVGQVIFCDGGAEATVRGSEIW